MRINRAGIHGIEGARRERRLVAHTELGNELVIVSGRTEDDAGYEELLTIASTVGRPRLATEAEVVAGAEAYVRANGYVDPSDLGPKVVMDRPPPGTTTERSSGLRRKEAALTAQWTTRCRRKRTRQVPQSSNPDAAAWSIVRYAGSRLAPQNALGAAFAFLGTPATVRLRGDVVARR
jgi:hypothetical protein